MAKQLTGYLPYNSIDETVVFNVSLKGSGTSCQVLDDLVTSGDLDSWNLLGSGGTFSDSGFNGNGTGGLRIILSDANADLLDHICEIGFDIQSTAFTLNDPTTVKSYGNLAVSAEERILDCYTSTGYANGLQAAKGSGSTITSYQSGALRNKYTDRIVGASSTNNTWRPHSETFNEEFTRFSIDVKPNVFALAMGGMHAVWTERAQNTRQFKVLVFSCDRGIQYFLTGNIKNLTLAARDVVIPVIPPLRKVGMVGDSLTDPDDMTNGYRTASPAFGFRKYFEEKGLICGEFYTSENGGFDVSELNVPLDTMIAQDPSIICYRGLTNDVTVTNHPSYAGNNPAWSYLIDNADPLLTTTGADLLDQMERALGVNGNAATTVEKVVIGGVPHKPSQTDPEVYVIAANGIVDAIVAYLNTNYGPDVAVKADTFGLTDGFNATSGTDPLSDVFSDGTHLWPRWSYRMGRQYASSLEAVL